MAGGEVPPRHRRILGPLSPGGARMPTCRQYASWILAGLVLGCGGGGGSGPGPTPAIVIKTAGDAQVGPAGSALASPLEVTVKDAQGNPVSGADVAFHPPPFVLEAAFRRGHFELVVGPAALHRLRRVERREVTADDLLGLVAL